MSSFIPVAKQELETEVFVLSFALITLRMGTPQNDFGVWFKCMYFRLPLRCFILLTNVYFGCYLY